MTSSNVALGPQAKDAKFAVIMEERNQKIYVFKRLESEIFYLYCLKKI